MSPDAHSTHTLPLLRLILSISFVHTFIRMLKLYYCSVLLLDCMRAIWKFSSVLKMCIYRNVIVVVQQPNSFAWLLFLSKFSIRIEIAHFVYTLHQMHHHHHHKYCNALNLDSRHLSWTWTLYYEQNGCGITFFFVLTLFDSFVETRSTNFMMKLTAFKLRVICKQQRRQRIIKKRSMSIALCLLQNSTQFLFHIGLTTGIYMYIYIYRDGDGDDIPIADRPNNV